ncbi:MAG: endonuclease [Bacteroidales bacterium]|nr:endonuclease [Bacteroidales bacterium]
MKKIFTLFLVLFAFTCFSQIPAGYYDSAEDLTNDELKTTLYNIIKNHTEYPYTDSETDVWDILKESDRDPDNSENVILLYTGWSVNAAQEYNSGSGWNREHVWAKSRGDFGTDEGPGTDAHHLRPCDISVNSARNNRWFNYCTERYYDNGGTIPTDSYTSYTDWFWQPRDEVKGDVARMIFYMATRYEGENGEPDLEVINYIPSDKDTKEPIHAKLDALLDWNEEDPVDDFERNRNEVVYSYQHNRNPFIDHPEYVNAIYVTSTTGVGNNVDLTKIKIYPNPAKNILHVDSKNDFSVEFYSIIGEKVLTSKQSNIDIQNLKAGIYFVVVKDEIGRTLTCEKLIKD